MKTCPLCYSAIDDASRFCPVCGGEQPVAAPAEEPVAATVVNPEPPVSAYAPPPYVTPIQAPYAPPAAPPPSKGKAIAGMALSIAGTVLGAIGIFLSGFFLVLGAIDWDLEIMGIMAFTYSIVFLLYALPLSIVGLVLSRQCVAQGSTMTVCRYGKIFGIVGLALCGALVVLAIVCLAVYIPIAADPYSYYSYY